MRLNLWTILRVKYVIYRKQPRNWVILSSQILNSPHHFMWELFDSRIILWRFKPDCKEFLTWKKFYILNTLRFKSKALLIVLCAILKQTKLKA